MVSINFFCVEEEQQQPRPLTRNEVAHSHRHPPLRFAPLASSLTLRRGDGGWEGERWRGGSLCVRDMLLYMIDLAMRKIPQFVCLSLLASDFASAALDSRPRSRHPCQKTAWLVRSALLAGLGWRQTLGRDSPPPALRSFLSSTRWLSTAAAASKQSQRREASSASFLPSSTSSPMATHAPLLCIHLRIDPSRRPRRARSRSTPALPSTTASRSRACPSTMTHACYRLTLSVMPTTTTLRPATPYIY